MATQKESMKIRADFATLLKKLNSEDIGFEFLGFTIEGALFRNYATDDYVVLKTIVKSEGFDPDDALAEYAERAARAAERAKKKQEKVENAKKKLEKEAAKSQDEEEEAEQEEE